MNSPKQKLIPALTKINSTISLNTIPTTFKNDSKCCIVTTNYTYTYTCKNNNDEQTQFFRKIYLSLYWKGCVWEVSWRLNKDCNILTPPAPPAIAVCLFRSPGLLNRGPGDPASLLRAGSQSSIWNTDFKLWTPSAWLPVSPGLYHCSTPTQFNPSTVKVIPWFLWPDAPVIYTGAFLIWQLGWVGGQYATQGQW